MIEKLYFWVADSLQPRGLVQHMLTLKLLGGKKALFEIKTERKIQVCVCIYVAMYAETETDKTNRLPNGPTERRSITGSHDVTKTAWFGTLCNEAQVGGR